jgi:hypothetical protein
MRKLLVEVVCESRELEDARPTVECNIDAKPYAGQ